MSTLVFSDSHLGLPFEEKKYNFLRQIISKADRVLINGDFWEGHLFTFDQFVNSGWKNLFPLLKEKKTVYVYGNHDEEEQSDQRVNLFSDIQAKRYDLKIGDTTYIFEHGDRLAFLPRQHPFFTKRAMEIEKVMVRSVGTKFHKVIGGALNKKIKTGIKTELKENEFYLCGHSHYAEMDTEKKFANSGLVRHGLGQYLLIEDGKVLPKEEWYD